MSNLGYHASWSNEYSGQIEAYAALGKRLPALCSVMNRNDPGKSAPAINAALFSVVRHYEGEQEMSGTDAGELTISVASQNALRFAGIIAPYINYYPGAYWMYWRNEINIWSKADFYALEMAAWIGACQGLGVKAAIGGFSFGTPDYDVWPAFRDVLSLAKNAGALLNLHEYGVNDMRVSGLDPAGDRHHCLRYRTVKKAYPSYVWPQIFIGETGLDVDVNIPEGDPARGGPWRAIGTSPESYLDQLLWYEGEIRKDGVVACVFQESQNAEDFDIHLRRDSRGRGDSMDVSGALHSYIAAGTPVVTPMPPGPIEVPPEPGGPGAYKTTAPVKLRPYPDKNHGTFGVQPAGTALTVEQITGDWAEVKAYVHKDYIVKTGD